MQENGFEKMAEGDDILIILDDTAGFGFSGGGYDSIDSFSLC